MTFTKVLVGRANLCPICKEPINFSITCSCTTVYTEVSSPWRHYNSVQTIAIETKLHNTICIWRERKRGRERAREREREMHCIRIFCICTTYLSVAVKPINPRKGDYLSIHALLSTDQRSYLILHRFTQTHIAYDPLYRTNCKTVGLHMACWSHSWISSDCTVDHHSSIIHVYISPNSKQPFSKFLAECKNSEVLHFKKWSSFEYSSDWGTE